MIKGEPQNFVSDFFGLGIVTYELIFGKRPFEGDNKDEIANSILNKKIYLDKNNMVKNFSLDAADFINRLLRKNNKQRLGSRGIEEIKNHKWLEDLDWFSIEYKNIDTKEIGIINVLKKNERKDKLGDDINFRDRIEKYSIILNKINKDNIFKEFYFNYNDNKNNEDNNIKNDFADDNFFENED